MSPELVFAKTPAGEEAVQQRTRLVQRNLRTVLIVIDGHSNVQDLCEKVGSQQVVESALEQLERDGYIEAVAAPKAPPEDRSAAEDTADDPYSLAEFSPFRHRESSAEAGSPPGDGSVPSPFRVPEEPQQAASRSVPGKADNGRAGPSRILGRLAAIAGAFAPGRARSAADDDAIKPIRSGQRARSLGLAGWLGIVAASLVLVVVVGVLAFPYGSYRSDIETALSGSFGRPVSVGSVYGAFSPVPRLVLERIRVGEGGEIEIREIRAAPTLASLFGPSRAYRDVVVDGLSLPVGQVSSVVEALSVGLNKLDFTVGRVELTDATVMLGDIRLGGYSGELVPETGERPLRLALNNAERTIQAQFSRGPNGVLASFSGSGWRFGPEPAQQLDSIAMEGKLVDTAFTANKVESRVFGGVLNGQLAVDWAQGVRLRGDFGIEQVAAARLSEALGGNVRLDGELSGRLRATAEADRFASLAEKAAFDGEFLVRRGNVQGLDLVEAVRRGGRAQVRGGATFFEQLSGRAAWSGQALRLTGIELHSGALRANGNMTLAKGRPATGGFNVQLRGDAAEIRAAVAVSGGAQAIELTSAR